MYKRLVAPLALAVATVVLAAGASSVVPQEQQRELSATEAKNHVGEQATVCGLVASARYVSGSRGKPTFLNLDKPYPSQPFTVVIWGGNRSDFPEPPEQAYADMRICVAGRISEYRGTPQIVVRTPEAINVWSQGQTPHSSRAFLLLPCNTAQTPHASQRHTSHRSSGAPAPKHSCSAWRPRAAKPTTLSLFLAGRVP
jgi:hypothetical protein